MDDAELVKRLRSYGEDLDWQIEDCLKAAASRIASLSAVIARVEALCDDAGYTWKPNDELLPIVSANKIRAALAERGANE